MTMSEDDAVRAPAEWVSKHTNPWRAPELVAELEAEDPTQPHQRLVWDDAVNDLRRITDAELLALGVAAAGGEES